MNAEIISIGSELVSGQSLDTNSQWLSTRLAELGVAVRFHTTVGDDLAENVAVLRTASERALLVVITGGLGPTQDDLTREAIAEAAGVALELDQPSLEHIEELFARRGRAMPERNRVQAMFPRGSRPLFNPEGTAPGIWMELARPSGPPCVLAAMPGVPSEMKRMYDDELVPRLRPLLDGASAGRVILSRKIHCFGFGESAVEEKLMDLTRRGREPEVGITAHEATITLRITARGETADACRRAIEPTARLVYERLGSAVYGEEGEELQDAVVRLLNASGQSLATVELQTGGLIAQRLCAVARSAQCYRGGVVAVSKANRREWLGTDENAAEAASQTRLVAALACAARERLQADLAVAVGAVYLPDPSATPHVCIALANPGGVHTEEHNVGGDPAILNSRLAKIALNHVRLHVRPS